MPHPFRSHLRLVVLVCAIFVLLAAAAFPVKRFVQGITEAHPHAYWGALIGGDVYGYSNPPWDMRGVDTFAQHAGKEPSILHWGQPWYLKNSWPHGFYPFVPRLMDAVRARGMIPLLDWDSWDYEVTPQYNQPRFSLRAIIDGTFDPYIRTWAAAARRWGHPFFVRFDHEMNGTWYPWSEKRNGNLPGQYVQAWRHVHDIFVREGALNVSWVWCVNAEYPGSTDISELYPGDEYVDWVAIDGYNTGAGSGSGWKSFHDVFQPTYEHLLHLAPHKPMMIAETASSETGGSKASWIRDALTSELPTSFPDIRAILWFNERQGHQDWPIESSPSAQTSFASGIASSYYAGNDYSGLSASGPIPVP